jgi:hypothetical protein
MNDNSTLELNHPEKAFSPSACQSKDKVDIRSLKSLVFAEFPRGSVTYDIFVTEHDLLSVSEFLVKVDVWLRLLRRIKN